MKDLFSLNNKTIVITGASSGIGRQCAISCSQMGAQVVLCGRNEERLHKTLSLMDNQDSHIVKSFDLTETDKLKEIVSSIISEIGPIDGYIGSAGIANTLPLRNIKPEQLDSFFQINVKGQILLVKELTKKSNFNAEGGSIIFLTSIMAHVGEMAKTLYSMSKGALLSASKSMALELASKKIRVNTISPGVVVTPMTNSAFYSQSEENRQRVESLHPLGTGKPEDVAAAVIYLLSDASRWVTGSDLRIDGGYIAR